MAEHLLTTTKQSTVPGAGRKGCHTTPYQFMASCAIALWALI